MHPRLILASGTAVAVFIIWLVALIRVDVQNDLRQDSQEIQIETLQEAERIETDVDSIDDSDLFDELCQRLYEGACAD